MIKGRDIIVVGIQAWDIEIGSNCKNIATEFSVDNRVLYVNPPTDRISAFRERKNSKLIKRKRIRKGIEPSLVKINSNLWNLYPPTITESINWIPCKRLFRLFNRINARRFCKEINKASDKLNFKNPIVFNDSSMFLGMHIMDYLSPSFYVYYMRDFLIKNPYWRKHGLTNEPVTISKAQLVVTNSELYAEYGREHNKHSYMVGQGCDTDAFDPEKNNFELPEDLSDISNPIVGYVGYLSSRRLSIDILEHISEQLPDWNLVLVGPEDNTFKSSSLHKKNNIHFLGSKDPSTLPGYIKGFDVAINPQLINDATMGNYPRKIDEYLILGKPVVASSTKAMEYFSEYVYLCETKEMYVKSILKAREEDNSDLYKKRMDYGKSHSWENNVKKIYDLIIKVSKEKNISI